MATERFTAVLHYLRQVGDAAEEGSDRQLLERFTRSGDQEAFATLLRRHGPMVWGVCRRLLRDVHDAEDAFQATFLLLVRKASGLRWPGSLGPWLFGVARRTALKARSHTFRRSRREVPLSDVPAAPDDRLDWADLRPLLDDAIDALPLKFQVPFVLCYLQGLTNAEAARRLGCPPGTIATRLARARQRLRSCLTRRGVTLAGGLLAVALVEATAEAMPAGLLASTLRTATAFTAGVVPALHLVALTKGVGNAMLLEKLKVMTAGLLAIGLVSVGTAVGTYQALAGDDRNRPPVVGVPLPPPAANAPVYPPPLAPLPAIKDELAARTEGSITFRTDNFAVTAGNRRIAQLVAEAAERQRKAQALAWLGKELPAWNEICPIQVTVTISGSAGATSFQFEKGHVLGRNMTVQGGLEQILATVLPHEVTHTVLADFFRAPVPRWADEGIAMLSEDEEEQQRHAAVMQKLLETPARMIPLRRLMAMKDFPSDVMVLYAEGYSVTRYLVEKKDRKTFLAFVKEGNDKGWDAAVKEHYGYKDVEELEDVWLKSTAIMASIKWEFRIDLGVKPEGLDTSPPPTTGLAHLDGKRGLVVRQPVIFYEPKTAAVTTSGNEPPRSKTVYLRRVTMKTQVFEWNDVEAFDRRGNSLDATKLQQRLRQAAKADDRLPGLPDNEVPVLIATDGKKVAPYHLQLVAEDAVILVLPGQPAVVEPATPPLPSPRPE